MDSSRNSEFTKSNNDHPKNSKVAQLIGDYDLSDLGDELEQRWLGNGVERQSLRNLADWFNQRLLESLIEQTNKQTVNGEIENLYRLLTSNEISSNARTQAVNRLNRIGVDVEDLKEDFVSHQAIHTYLTEFRGVNHDPDRKRSNDTTDKRKESIQKLRNRVVAVTEFNVKSLRETDRLKIGAFDVTVSINVYCRKCNKSFSITEIIERGHCDCH